MPFFMQLPAGTDMFRMSLHIRNTFTYVTNLTVNNHPLENDMF